MNAWFWLELFLRAGLLLGMAEVLRRLASRDAAGFRHTLLLCAFGLLAVLPLLSVFLPSLAFPIWKTAFRPQSSITIHERFVVASAAPHAANWLFLVWLLGFLAALAPMLIGLVSAWRIASRSQRFADEVLLSPELRVPVTCGFFRPRILLPAAAQHWQASRMAAVLAHERAHIGRRDLAAQTFSRFVAAVWWFQPLVWFACRKLRAESELACDTAAIGSGLRPSAYAAELLAIAQNAGPAGPLSAVSISMARSGDLENRLAAILDPVPALPSKPRCCALTLALVSAAIVASASNLNEGGSTMKRTITAALLTSAGLSAATLNGSVHDASGVPVADAKVSIVNPDTAAKQDAVTGTDGRFTIATPAAGQYILRIEKPGFASLLREYDLGSDTTLDRTFTMGGTRSAKADIDRESCEKTIPVGGAVAEANAIKRVPPVYPQAAKAAGTEGSVDIEATISKEGAPVELKVVSSPSDDLSQSALEAVRQWRYQPTLLNGEPVAIVSTVTINYTLAK